MKKVPPLIGLVGEEECAQQDRKDQQQFAVASPFDEARLAEVQRKTARNEAERAAIVLTRTKPPFKPSGICQAEPAPARSTMYPQIRPENSIASEARNVIMPKRTTFGPALWGTESIATADALIGQAL